MAMLSRVTPPFRRRSPVFRNRLLAGSLLLVFAQPACNDDPTAPQRSPKDARLEWPVDSGHHSTSDSGPGPRLGHDGGVHSSDGGDAHASDGHPAADSPAHGDAHATEAHAADAPDAAEAHSPGEHVTDALHSSDAADADVQDAAVAPDV